MASTTTGQEQEDALAQIESVVNSGDGWTLVAMLTDDQIRGLAADFNEGKEDEHDGQPDEAQEWADFDPDC